MKTSLIFSLTIFIRMNSIAQDSEGVSQHVKYQASSTFDPAWASRFHSVLDSAVQAAGIKGASLAVLAPGQGLFTAVTGISSGVPITPDMRFGIGSNTKTFIAVTLLKLQEQGVLSLDDPLYRWLPAFPKVDSTITIRQLLSHQSGIFSFTEVDTLLNMVFRDTSRFWTPREILATIGNPYFVKGTGFHYSNTNYLLAGMIIQAATGKSWVQNLHDIILNPLNMTSTFAGAFEPYNGPVANQWLSNFNGFVKSPVTSQCSLVDAAGSLLSTAQEMVEWYHSLFSGEVISSTSLLELTDFDPHSFYGLGIWKDLYRNHLTYCHTGWINGYMSGIFYDTGTKATICILINENYAHFDTWMTLFLNVFFDDHPKKPNDAGISGITTPVNNICGGTAIPSVILKNFGSAPLTIVDINCQVDSAAPFVYKWTGVLSSGARIPVLIPQLTTGNGFHSFTCYTSSPNGSPEGNTYNDTAQSNFIASTVPTVKSELYEGFDGNIFPPAGWTASSSALKGSWVSTSLAHYTGTGSASYPNFNDRGIGNFYDLELPALNISSTNKTNLSFRYSYGLYSGSNGDSLQVLISLDCGTTWQKIYDKGGTKLATSSSSIAFYPLLKANWRKETISLSAYPGNVLIRFRNICGYGNNIFLDDVNVEQLTGIQETSLANKFTVYPNPASTTFNISGLPANSEIQLTDLTGKMLISGKTENSLTVIEIGKLPTGVYILRTALGMRKIVKL